MDDGSGLKENWKEVLEYVLLFFSIIWFISYFIVQFTTIIMSIIDGVLDFNLTIHYFYVAHTIILFIILLTCYIYYFYRIGVLKVNKDGR